MFISPSVFSPSCAVWALSPKSLVAAAGHRLFLLQLLKSLRLHRLLWLLWLPAFIPYAKVKKLILTHYILFIWKNRCFFFPMLLFLLACYFPSSRWISLVAASLPQRPGQPAPPQRSSQQLCHGSTSLQSLRHGVPASISASAPLPATSSRWRSATAPLPATNLIRRRKLLRFG